MPRGRHAGGVRLPPERAELRVSNLRRHAERAGPQGFRRRLGRGGGALGARLPRLFRGAAEHARGGAPPVRYRARRRERDVHVRRAGEQAAREAPRQSRERDLPGRVRTLGTSRPVSSICAVRPLRPRDLHPRLLGAARHSDGRPRVRRRPLPRGGRLPPRRALGRPAVRSREGHSGLGRVVGGRRPRCVTARHGIEARASAVCVVPILRASQP
mmetsp:Transcript_19601/g.55261  ORF Transcript_19601/g.55261 Transcript_19601/m.55261 type:complete len:214 (-) Transcript_19601:38-679(-)